MIEYLLRNYIGIYNYLPNEDLNTLYMVLRNCNNYIPDSVWEKRVIRRFRLDHIEFFPMQINLVYNTTHKFSILKKNYSLLQVYKFILNYGAFECNGEQDESTKCYYTIL